MPFKIKLKKSRHYNVTSKSLFVISVHHLLVLDTPTTVDCTLSSESTGQECLENVCQRLSINQPEFFGLRYVVKGSDSYMRWVDLERPLSRQLEKYASSPKLYLRIMYYLISGVAMITDEVTRNYYFLQLKSDVVDGRILCDQKQAVSLAIYCRQAQYDSYQSERHTVDYLKTLLPFPKHLIEAGLLETLTEEVLQSNSDIQNLTQSTAEGLFIAACQQLDGYGQERFNAKDNSGQMVTLGVTVGGIVVNSNDGSYIFYPWHDISNVVNHKRTFTIECAVSKKGVSFSLADADTGRYFWKLCVLQHTFFMKYEQNQIHLSEQNLNLFQNVPEDLNESRDNLFIEQSNIYASDSHIPASLMWPPHQQHHQQRTESIKSSNISLTASQQQLRGAFEQNWTPILGEHSNANSNWALIGSNTSLNNSRAQSTSCLDLSNNTIQQERERLKAFLPGYRQAPDYETAVQQKHRSSESELRMIAPVMHAQNTAIASEPHIQIYSGSQPDVHRATAFTDAIFGQQLQQQYPDVTQITNQVHPQHFDHNVIGGVEGLSHQLQKIHFNKPPPPYQTNRLSSTSTPDLASHRSLFGYRESYVSGSSPDLVSTRTFLNPQFMSQQQVYPALHPSQTFRHRYSQGVIPHGTYENFNFIDRTTTNLLSHKFHQNANYRNQQTQSHNDILKINQHHNGSIEPIYENIPLPWQGESSQTEMRDRASSIQSAPSAMLLKKPQPQPYHQHESHHKNEANDFTITNTNPAMINDLKNNNLVEHPMLSQTTSNHITVTHHNHSQQTPCNEIIDSGESASNQTFTIMAKPQIEVLRLQQLQQVDKPMHHTKIEINATNNQDSANNNRLHSMSNILDTSQRSTFTNQTATASEPVVNTGHKEKKKRRWGFFGGDSESKSNTSDKLKFASLSREKGTSAKGNASSQEGQNRLKQRWSTGLPRHQPLSTTISKEKLSQILEEKLYDSHLYVEFECIPKRKENARYDCALHEENRLKNLDPNFLPYDDNRVRITPSLGNRFGYVNASNIQVTVGKKQRFYIVAQSPHSPQTLQLFWQCVWEADVYLIVQLSEEMNYIPATSDKCLDCGQYQLFQEFSQNTGRCVTSKLRLYHAQSRRYRSVWHLKYTNWAEQNCPSEVEHFLDFLKELSSVRLASVNEVPPGHNTNPPVLIHCSEGGGRAGVTLASDLLLYTLDHNQDLDIPRVVGQLRHQRDNIIPSLAQYKFIYALLINSLKQTRLI